jgi:hypothetical protein
MVKHLFAALLLVSCTKTLGVGLDVVPACDQPDVLSGMQNLTVVAEGDALDAPREETFPFTAGKGRITEIPPTSNAVLTVLVRRGSADSAVDVAGANGPYDLTGADNNEAKQARIVVARTGSFAGTSGGPKPSVCTSLVKARHAHTATRLLNGRVLIAGGKEVRNGETLLLRNTEVFDPERGVFEEGPDLPEGRAHHTASLLPSGKVLLCGGQGALQNKAVSLGHCVSYDPSAATFTPNAVTLVTGRMKHAALSLPDGRVMLSGGIATGGMYLATTEIFDPNVDGLERTIAGPSLVRARAEHTSSLVSDGALIVGGRDEDEPIGDVELWSQSTARKIADGIARYGHAAARASDGRIVIAGGFTSIVDASIPTATAAVEIFDPQGGGTLSCGSELALATPRGGLFAAASPRSIDGLHRMVIGGGLTPDGATSSVAEVITLPRGKACGDSRIELARTPLKNARMDAQATPLTGGDVLITGGAEATGMSSRPSSTSELFISFR